MKSIFRPQIGEIDPKKALEAMMEIRTKRALARRNFIKNVGLAGVGMAAGAVFEGCSSSSVSHAQGPTPADILNFALNLEYLEGEFYSWATTGAPLSSTVLGANSMAENGSQVSFVTPEIQDVAGEIAFDEMLHIEFLRTALGAAAVAEPVIDLSALGAYTNEYTFLTLARAFEDVGVSAYAGAAPGLVSNPTYLGAAAQILAVEAYHAGNIRLNIILKENQLLAPNYAAAIPGAVDSMDIPPQDTPFPNAAPFGQPPNMAHYFTTIQSGASQGLAVIRNTSEVLAIVYGNAAIGTSSGGFFPNGVNGTINTVTTT
jgi:ferritin-like protein